MTLRIGVNTGEVVATSDSSSGDFLATGDAVNVAARLQQCANPGEILASERTHTATEPAFLFAEGRKVEAKGKRQLLRAFPLVGVQPTRRVERPPLVGRKRELTQRPGAYWLLLGPEVILQRTEYDVERAAEEIRASGLPGADEFARENVLNPPSASEATAIFERMAAED